ncbi:hypothetical protein C6497_02855 [Candidatus Poribacteria bacterium]|nr:MAG: hypothetical protein C6497_02855 [Candidatus Poribacteria bacterium]
MYLNDIGVQEYFIHQPELKKSAEFYGWRRSSSGDIVEMDPDAEGGLFSEVLNLWFRWTDDHKTDVRLLRPYLPDGTPITTSTEAEHLHLQEKHLREEAEAMAAEEAERREEAEAMAAEETERRRTLEIELEQLRAQLANGQNDTL